LLLALLSAVVGQQEGVRLGGLTEEDDDDEDDEEDAECAGLSIVV